jgi:hypothetical protein
MITKILDGQNCYDLALQLTGSADNAVQIALNSQIENVTGVSKLGYTVDIPQVKNQVTLSYRKGGIKPANSVFTSEQTNGGFSGEYTGPEFTKEFIID